MLAWNRVYALDGDHGNVCSRCDSRMVGVLRTAGRSSTGHRGGRGTRVRQVGEAETADEASLEPYGLDVSRAPALLRYRPLCTRSVSHFYVLQCVCVSVHDPVPAERAHSVNTFYSDLARLIVTWATYGEAVNSW